MSSRKLAIGQWFDTLVELIYPPRCISCRRLGSHFCHACLTQAEFIGDSICVHCGQATTVRCTCSQCRRSPASPLRGMRGAVFYGGAIPFAIHGLKYRGMRQLAGPLASYQIGYLQAHPIPIDHLVPVPLHADRLVSRGYNQSELLAQAIGKARKLPVRGDLIERTRHTLPQVHLNRQQRLDNVKDAFAPLPGAKLQGETVLLIDDVCTTGATLRGCAEALKQVGAGDVWALAIARARPKREPEPWEKGLMPADIFLAWDGSQAKPQF